MAEDDGDATAPLEMEEAMANPAAGMELEPEPEPEPQLQSDGSSRSLASSGGSASDLDSAADEDVGTLAALAGIGKGGLAGLGDGLLQSAGRLHRGTALLTGAAPVVNFKQDEFHDDDLYGGMAHLRHFDDDGMMGSFKTEKERHERLMQLISMATGDNLDADGNHIDDDDEADLAWDIDEDLFKYASIEGMTGMSLKLFRADHPLRVKASEIINNVIFEYTVVGTILVMMVGLALDSPERRYSDGLSDDERRSLSAKPLEVLALVVFTVEAMLRIVAQGFVLGRNTYLRSGWNVLDFIIVGSAWAVVILRNLPTDDLTVAEQREREEYIEILLSMRLIRPLHTLRYFKGVKTLLAAISFSGPQMATVTMLMTIFFVIFGSFGIELWQGTVSRTCDPGFHDLPIADIAVDELKGVAFSWDDIVLSMPEHAEKLIPVGVGENGGCPKTMIDACRAAADLYNESVGLPEAAMPGTCYAVPDQYRETGDWMDASNTFGFDNMWKAVLTLFIMTTLDEWPLIQRRIQESECGEVCAVDYLWTLMLIMVILLALLGANLFIAVLTFSYSQVLNRQDMAKKRLGDLAKLQDGPRAIVYLEGEMQKVAMHQVLGHNDMGLQYGSGLHKGEIISGDRLTDQTNDGRLDAIDSTGDGHSNLLVVGEEDSTGDGRVDTLVVKELGSSSMSRLSVVANNPEAWPHIKGVSEPCRKMVLHEKFDLAIGVVILCNAIVMASVTYPQAPWQQHLEILDYVFIVIYVWEVIVKILGLGLKPYFAVPFHDLDFLVVLASLLSIIYPQAKGATASRMIRLVLRVIRMLRLLKLVSKVDTVVYLIKALTTSGGSVVNMTGLIFFTVTLVATICMHIFGDCASSQAQALEMVQLSRSNFYSFGSAFLTNIQLLTGEDWAPIMFQYMEACGTSFGAFFIAIMLIYNFMLMNLFTAIILQNFSVSEHEKMNHQKQAYRDKRGQQAVEDDMAILEWLADAAEGDDAASRAIQKALSGMATGVEHTSKCMEKFCSCCHHKVHEDEELAVLIDLQRRHVEAKSRESDVIARYVGITNDIEAIESEPGDMTSLRTQRRAELLEERAAIEKDHSKGKQEIAALTREIENEQRRLEQKGRALKHIERSQETGHKSYSCCCLKQNNRIRHFCHDVTQNWLFEGLIFTAIIASSWCLSYHPLRQPDSVVWLNHICTSLFLLEFVMRVIDTNFVRYIAHGWNALDFVIVTAAILEFVIEYVGSSTEHFDLSLLKIMRMLRLLRAVRAIRHVEQLKLIVDVLVGCVPTVMAALAIVLIIFTCFGVLGLSLFGGMFYRCECGPSAPKTCDEGFAAEMCLQMFYGLDANYNDLIDTGSGIVVNATNAATLLPKVPPKERLDPCDYGDGHGAWNENRTNGLINISTCCTGSPDLGFGGDVTDGFTRAITSRSNACLDQVRSEVEKVSDGVLAWNNPPYNFDDIFWAIQTMFYMATTEGWVDIMHAGQDVPLRPGLAPVQDFNWTYCVYFVAFQVIGAAFSMSLFTGVLVNYFAESSGSGILTRKQQEWVHAKLLVLRAHSVTEVPPSTAVRQAAHWLYTWSLWEVVVTGVIIVQVLVIVAVEYPQNAFVIEWELAINMVCLCFFTFELILGILAIGFGPFIRSGWAKFDFVVVVLSWMAFAMEHILEKGSLPSVQALRATRIVRILTLFRGSSNLKALFAALVLSVPPVVNITLLMLLVFFVFGVLGMHLYNTMPFQDPPANLNDMENFNSTAHGMRLLFEVATGHDFLNTVHEMQLNYERGQAEFGHPFAFFFLFYVVGAFILVNLFVAMLLENVQISLASENSVIQAEHTDAFKKEWDAAVHAGRGQHKLGKPRLNCYDVFNLIRTLNEPLGRVEEIDNWEHRLLLEMQVGLKANRRKTHVTFENALMATCVLYLSNACLPYDLQHSRLLDILNQQQETATRIIQCRAIVMIRLRRVPTSIKTLTKNANGKYITKRLDTPELIAAYRRAVVLFGNLAANLIASCNRMNGLTNDAIKPRGEQTGEVKVRFDRRPEPSRHPNEIRATVLECRNLRRMDILGDNDPYVIVGVNSATHRTETVSGGGEGCVFDRSHRNVLRFHTAATLEDVVVRVFDEDPGGASTDDQIGCTIDLAAMFRAKDEQEANGQWTYEGWFDIRREMHMLDRHVASRTQEDNNLREMIKLSRQRESRKGTASPSSPPRDQTRSHVAPDPQTADAQQAPGGTEVINPLREATQKNDPIFPEVEVTEREGNVITRHKRSMQRRMTLATMDADFNPRTTFYRVVRTAVVRTGSDVTKSPIRGFLRAGDVVMGFEEENYGPQANLAGVAERAGSSVHTVTRIRVKRVNAGRLNLTNVLQGWTSIQTFNGENVLQEFDLFDSEEYGTDAPPTASARREPGADVEGQQEV